MRASHRIAAVLLAILVASPLCCCLATSSAPETPDPESCCRLSQPDSGRDPEGSPCPDCQAGQPRLADGQVSSLPLLPAVPVALPEWVGAPALLSATTVAHPAPVDPDPGPPRRGLVLRQSFLI